MVGDDLTVEYSAPSLPGLLDSGSTCMTMPTTQYIILRNKLVPLLSSFTVDSSGMHVFDCAENESRLIPFFVKYGGYWVQVNPKDYLFYRTSTECSFCFLSSVKPYWVLGVPILKDYYVAHDYTNQEVSFAPLKNNAKRPLFKSEDPT